VDLRAVNSWRLTLAEVSTPEMIEVQLVNSVAPFIQDGEGGAQHAHAHRGPRLRARRDPHERRGHGLDRRRGSVRPRDPQRDELGFQPRSTSWTCKRFKSWSIVKG